MSELLDVFNEDELLNTYLGNIGIDDFRKDVRRLVEEKFTSTNSGYTAALENIIKWLLGERGDFPAYTGGGHYYWRTELRKRLNAAQKRHCV